MAKVSKNARAAQRLTNAGGKDYIKLVKSIKNPVTGKYSYKTMMIHKDNVKEVLAAK